jgi:hypothetical protein
VWISDIIVSYRIFLESKSKYIVIFPLEFFRKFHANKQNNKTTRLSGIVRYIVGGGRSDGERERAKGVGLVFRFSVSFLVLALWFLSGLVAALLDSFST